MLRERKSAGRAELTHAESGCADRDAGRTGPGLGFHDDLNILPESDQKAHQPLHREAFQLVMQEGGDLRLIDFERRRSFSLGKSTPLHNPVDGSTALRSTD